MASLKHLISDGLEIIPFTQEMITTQYIAWLNDPVVVRYSEQRHRFHDEKSCESFYRSLDNSPSHFSAIFEGKIGLGHIGNISTTVNVPNSTADIAIMIGEKESWGKGFGFLSWKMVMDELLRLNFRKITGGCMLENDAMIRVMEKSGMKHEYTRTKSFLLNGSEVDSIHFSIYNKHFNSSK